MQKMYEYKSISLFLSSNQFLDMLLRNIPQCQTQAESRTSVVCVCSSPLCFHCRPFVLFFVLQGSLESWHLPNPWACLRPSPVCWPRSSTKGRILLEFVTADWKCCQIRKRGTKTLQWWEMKLKKGIEDRIEFAAVTYFLSLTYHVVLTALLYLISAWFPLNKFYEWTFIVYSLWRNVPIQGLRVDVINQPITYNASCITHSCIYCDLQPKCLNKFIFDIFCRHILASKLSRAKLNLPNMKRKCVLACTLRRVLE